MSCPWLHRAGGGVGPGLHSRRDQRERGPVQDGGRKECLSLPPKSVTRTFPRRTLGS